LTKIIYIYISPDTANKLKIRNAVAPKIYGLPKLHKTNVPLRPIVSCIQSPFTPLSKYLKQILSKVAYKNAFYIKDARHFKEKVKKFQIPDNYILVSLDVVSLYTSVPISLSLEIVKKKWEEIKKFTDIPQDEFLKAIEITLKSTYFLYQNDIYKQIEGCAMGASISSIIAQLVMENLEETVLSKINFHVPFFFRYVDDCITAIPKDKTDDILKHFNNFHKNLQFTMEIEKNNTINFLDVTLHHQNQNIKTEWYTKTTWSARYLHFKSSHPISQKKSVVIGLADRAIGLSDPEYRERAIKKAKNALKLNSYPETLINKIFKDRIHKFYNCTNSSPNHNKKKTTPKSQFISLPFINNLSQPFQSYFKNHNITVCHKGYNLLSKNFSTLKSKTPKNKKSNIIYQIPCNDCDGVYIGQTSQYLENRLKSHKYDKKNKTALTNHEHTKKHTFNYNNTKILKTESQTKKREFLEMVEIHKQKNAINDKKDVSNLNKIYIAIL
jgi:hypothetical protein